ncbi:MAG: PQQ-binding-like beta-propeller repeat protein, partial [Vicinamibacterales bacterium]|nr:PQQ-binding-like beta-propeller repeat protein [Vicinamibacterales bacterium]
LPASWSPDGENLAWRVPYGGRSAPIVLGGQVYIQNGVGGDESLQERLMAFDAGSGDLLWEHRFNVYLSDVPPHRVGWASPTGDPTTGHLYVYGAGGTLLSLTAGGELRWQRSLNEDFGLITTHGGRTVSPVLDGDLVIVSGLSSGWGNQAIGRHRFMAFNKNNGETVWVSTPGGRAFDTTYSTPIITDVDGTRLLIAGGGDGAVHAMQPQTGLPVWKFAMSKRGINAGVVFADNRAFVSHSEENLGTSEMGLLAAVDATSTGDLDADAVAWQVTGFQGGYASPVIDGDRIYQIDNSANLAAFDLTSGAALWEMNIGTIQRAAPVLADGKLYLGSVTGRFFILEPGRNGAEVLSEVQLGTVEEPEELIASPAIADGRVYVVTDQALYAIGPDEPRSSTGLTPPAALPTSIGPVSQVRVSPTELVVEPGQPVSLTADLFDARGRQVPNGTVTWALDGLEGTVTPGGEFVADPAAGMQAGSVTASAGGATSSARLRVIPPLPNEYDFEADAPSSSPSHWIASTGKFEVRDEAGSRVLVKKSDNPFTRRARVYIGDSDLSDYTVEANVSAIRSRRQMGDAGVNAQRHTLVLMGNHQRLELQTWQPETVRTVTMPFAWEPETWYRFKLSVENLDDGRVRARGKVWPRDEAEPADWALEAIDPNPHPQGSPGIYANAPFEIFFDNVRVY